MICQAVFWAYMAAAILALAIVPLSDMGLLGLEPDALAGVFAIALAQPWVAVVFEGMGDASQTWNLVIVGACLALNALLLRLACRLFRR